MKTGVVWALLVLSNNLKQRDINMVFEVVLTLLIIASVATIINGVQDYNKERSEMSFRESMDLTELPVITFYNGPNKLNFLLDTGSNMCVINSKSVGSLSYTKLNEGGSIHGMEGNVINVEHISMDFTYNNKHYTSVFQVVDMQEAFDRIKQESGVTIHGILGSKFFEEYKYILNFDKLIAYSK